MGTTVYGNILRCKAIRIVLVMVLLTGIQITTASAALQSAGVTSTSVTLTWTAPGDDGTSGSASQYDIRFWNSTITANNWDSAFQATSEPSPQPPGSTEVFTVTGLTPSTTYYFAVKTADEVPNWSSLSNVIGRTTDPETTPPGTVVDLGASNFTSTSALLTWTATGDDGSTGTAALYDIRYSTSPITLSNFDSATQISGLPTPQAAGAAESLLVSGLSSTTAFYFALKTADEVPNWSSISNVASGSTGAETVSPSDISDLAAINPTESTIDLSWTAPGDDGASGTASQYEIRYSTSPINDNNWSSATLIAGVSVPLTAGSSESITVSGLSLNTKYYFAIKTADEIPNWSGLSNVASDTTLNDQTPPAAITDLNSPAS